MNPRPITTPWPLLLFLCLWLIILTTPPPLTAQAIDPTSYARSLLTTAPTVDSEQALENFKTDLRTKVSAMSRADQIRFVSTLLRHRENIDNNNHDEIQRLGLTLMVVLGASKISPSIMAEAMTPLLDDSNPHLSRFTHSYLVRIGNRENPDGTLTTDFQHFIPALSQPAGRAQLVELLFHRSPGPFGHWLTDHTQPLDDAERQRIHQIIATGQSWEDLLRGLRTPDTANPARFPSQEVRTTTMRTWLQDPSWIVNAYARSLLDRHPAWAVHLQADLTQNPQHPIPANFKLTTPDQNQNPTTPSASAPAQAQAPSSTHPAPAQLRGDTALATLTSLLLIALSAAALALFYFRHLKR